MEETNRKSGQLIIDMCCSGIRRIPITNLTAVSFAEKGPPMEGDVVIGQIINIGQHRYLEITDGREVLLRQGITCALVLGRRYSTFEFHGDIPKTLALEDTFHLLNTGGVSGTVKARSQLALAPTKVKFLGYASKSSGEKYNIRDYALRPTKGKQSPFVILVVGSDMEVGKTKGAEYAIHALSRTGYKVGGMKLTGTSRMKDLYNMKNSGADPVLDFADFGLPSTFGASQDRIKNIFQKMCYACSDYGCEFMVVEVADGLFQPETFMVLHSKGIMEQVSQVIFASADPVAAFGGYTFLKNLGHAPAFLTGLFTRSRLGIREVRSHCSVPILSADPEDQKHFLSVAVRSLSKKNG
jgi:hypothetical protein